MCLWNASWCSQGKSIVYIDLITKQFWHLFEKHFGFIMIFYKKSDEIFLFFIIIASKFLYLLYK